MASSKVAGEKKIPRKTSEEIKGVLLHSCRDGEYNCYEECCETSFLEGTDQILRIIVTFCRGYRRKRSCWDQGTLSMG